MHYVSENLFQPHTIVLTTNTLLAQRLQQNIASIKARNNANEHKHPIVLSIQEWAEQLWANYTSQTQTTTQLLNTYQSQRVWQMIVKQTTLDNTTQRLAYEAWALCHRYQLNYQANIFKQNAYTHMWQDWAIQFEQECKAQNWLDPNHLFCWLRTEAHLGKLSLPQNIMLYGIDKTLPLYNSFFQALESCGCSIQPYKPTLNTDPNKVQSIAYSDLESQIYHMAQWAWQQWAQGTRSVGCVIPHLATAQDNVVSILQAVFHQEYPEHLADCPISIPFETTSSIDHPIIVTALDLLNLSIPFDFAALSRILRTPYIKGTHTEHTQRFQLERALRQQATVLSSSEKLQQQSQQYHCPQLADCLRQYAISPTDETRTFAAWAHQFKHQLTIWGWPYINTLTPEESQAIQKWHQALDVLLTLTVVEKPCTHSEALQHVIHYLQSESQPLQPTLPQNSLYLIDSQSAAYCDMFDALWIMNAHDLEQDMPSITNPFIPYTLQEKLSIEPLKHLIQHTNQTVLSTIAAEAAIATPKINALLSGIDIMADNTLAEDNTSYATLTPSAKWETFEDEQAPPVATDMTIKSGVDLIYQQANCPFKAFADYRLHLKHSALNLPVATLTTADKSQLLHRLFNRGWQRLKNQHNLTQLAEAELDHFLEQVIETEITTATAQKPDIWQPVFTQLEKEKLHKLLKKSLARDMVRPDFEVVAHPYEGTATINKLTLSFNIDRIDQLADGTQLLIDYTTRAATPTHATWIDNPKIALQFSLYHLHEKKPIESVSFFNITPDQKNPFYGISQDSIEIKGIHKIDSPALKVLPQPDWSTLTQHWGTTTHTLAQDFQDGNAAVQPKDGKMTCRYCQYAILCRVAQHHQPLSPPE